MQRRQFLATGATLFSVAVAGCAHPPVVLDMDEATADDIARDASMSPDPESEEYALVTSAIENGSARRTGSFELFDRTDTVEVNDTFYEVSETKLDSTEQKRYEVYLDVEPEDQTPERGEIAFEDLPAVDRERLEPVLAENPTPGGNGYEISVKYGTAKAVGDESVFVPQRQYDILVHEGTRYGIAVDSRTVSEATYQYEVTNVAADTEAFAERIRDRYLFALTGLSEAEREVVTEAIDSGYYEDTEAFRSVIDRLRDHDGLETEGSYGRWLVEYEGVAYLTYAEW